MIDRVQLTPVALAEGMWLAAHLFGQNKPDVAMNYEHIATAVFSHPNIGTVGMTEQALESCGAVRVYKASFDPCAIPLVSCRNGVSSS